MKLRTICHYSNKSTNYIYLVQLALIDVINKRAGIVQVVFWILIGSSERKAKHAQMRCCFDVRVNMRVQPIQLELIDQQTHKSGKQTKLYRDSTTSGCSLVCHIIIQMRIKCDGRTERNELQSARLVWLERLLCQKSLSQALHTFEENVCSFNKIKSHLQILSLLFIYLFIYLEG